ncbi:DUF4190 domain-containing protein [Bifidobacterium panos]|uniref:Peptidyl-prolyl cis-trans isomerase n=1 Tax=Bifidobacterium panos TaxID=2675321 RepID=A0ABX1T0C7_9BIFI|nr:DUF4190 domain-containing protein [Bifidobacterium sp. DSM 109963]NMN02482.1 peptidyl-prolyl cis-trans isomerase [Bifidobacterium sp. DSM 109963]
MTDSNSQQPYQEPNPQQSGYTQQNDQQYASAYTQQPYQQETQSAQPGATYPPQGVYQPGQQGAYPYPAQQQQNWNGMCIAGFVCSFLISIVGLILSIVGLKQAKQSGERGQGLAIAGIVISAVRIALAILLVILMILGFGAALAQYGRDHGYNYSQYGYYGGDYNYFGAAGTTSTSASCSQMDTLIASTYEACLAA